MRHSPRGWWGSGVACVGSCPFPIPRLPGSATGSGCARSNPRLHGSLRSRAVCRIRSSNVRCRPRSGSTFRTSCTCWTTVARPPSTRAGWRIDSVYRRWSACRPHRPSATAVTWCMSTGRRVRIGSIRGGCAACCQRALPGGLSGLGAGLARCLSAVRWPLHPYPTPIAFENRRDLLLGGLQFVDRICVDRDGERDLTISLGVRPDQVAILPRSASVGDWRSAYEAVR